MTYFTCEFLNLDRMIQQADWEKLLQRNIARTTLKAAEATSKAMSRLLSEGNKYFAAERDGTLLLISGFSLRKLLL